jgi:hypothetical protein
MPSKAYQMWRAKEKMEFLATSCQNLFPWLFSPCRCSYGIEKEREMRREEALTGGSGSMWVKQHFFVFDCVVRKKRKIIVSNPLSQ